MSSLSPPFIKLVSGTDLASKVPGAVDHAAPEQSLAAPKLGEILVDQGHIEREELESALESQRQWDAKLGDILCLEHGLKRSALLESLARQSAAPYIDLDREPHDPMLVTRFGAARCLAQRCLPWRRVGARTVILVDNPASFEELRDDLIACFGPVMMGMVAPEKLQHVLSRLHRRELRQRAEERVDAELSCRTWQGRLFNLAIAICLLALTVGALWVDQTLLFLVTAWALLTLAAVTLLKFMAAIASLSRRRDPAAHIIQLSEGTAGTKLPVVSLLVPLLNEDEIARGLVRNLSKLKYPRPLLDICLVVEADDWPTRETLQKTTLPDCFRVIEVPAGELRTKPRALNYALDFARGSIIGVYDAEDAPDPDQIEKVVQQFQRADPWVACIQGALDFYNRRTGWLTRCFTLDYAIWFRAVLPGLSRLRLPLPLGGTTLFFRRTALEKLGGWDAHNVTEDADLGLRLGRAGYRTELLDTVTHEQATSKLIPWIRQRSRWLKGYTMTYAVHMRTPLKLYRDLGLRGFLAVQIMFLGTISQYTLAPVLWSWWLVAFGLPHPVADALPQLGAVIVIALFLFCEAVSLSVGILAARRAKCLSMAPWLLTMTFYHVLATLACYKALFELISRPFYWDKTHHPAPNQEPQSYSPNASDAEGALESAIARTVSGQPKIASKT